MGGYLLDAGLGAPSCAWWELEETQMHQALCALSKSMRDQDSARRSRVLRWLRMYGNYAGATQGLNLDEARLRDNIIAENVDTAISEVTLQEPKAAFLTDGGDWSLQQAAKQRELLTDATLRNEGWYDGEGGYGKGRITMRDAALTGQGCVRVRPDWHALCPRIDRLLPLEWLVEEADGRKGSPRSGHLVVPYDRGVLAGQYPKLAKKILDRDKVKGWSALSDGGVEDWLIEDSKYADLVLVTESWHLPSYKGAADGKHVVVVDGLTLQCEQYNDAFFPVVWVNWKPAPVGFYGIGLAQDLQADQVELNRTLMKLQDTIGAAAGMWLLQKGAKVNPRHLTDLPGTIVEYAGVPPTWMQPNTFPADLVEHADRIRARARARAGINDMAATGAKPTGLQSGEAIRSYRDQFSMRQSAQSAAYEALTVAVAQRVVACYEAIYRALKTNKLNGQTEMPAVPVEVKRGRTKVLKRLRWEETSQPANECVISAFPQSALPNHPASRSQTVQEWLAGGLITIDEARALFDFPDTDASMKLQLADHNFALFCYETMTEDGEYVAPEPYQNLKFALELMRRAYLAGRVDGVPDARLDLVRRHMAEMERLSAKAASSMAPANAMPASPGMPAAPSLDPALAAAGGAMPPGAAPPLELVA